VIIGLDHVGVAVRSPGAAADFSRLIGQPASESSALPANAVRVCFVPQDAPNLELLAPLTDSEERTGHAGANSGPIDRFLTRRGEGLHHVCFAVDDIRAELARLAEQGFVLIDQVPRPGHGGLVAFIHPSSAHGVLVELLQREEST
jgi:methylmalonyl-CoA/ethylmalonyl-CoA epimerase